MEKRLITSLDGVESALDALSASIVAYNPSSVLAQSLVSADSDLKAALSELCIHQENARKLSDLRAEVDAIEAGNRMRLQGLANLHSELGEARLSGPKGRNVNVDELLNVAAATAKYAAPIGYKPPSFLMQIQSQQQQQQQLKQEDSSNQTGGGGQAAARQSTPGGGGAISPGAISSGAGITAAVASPDVMDTDTPLLLTQATQGTNADSSLPPTQAFTDSQLVVTFADGGGGNQASQPTANPGLSILSQADLNQLNPAGAVGYEPWISAEMIAKSHLARMQGVSAAIMERVEKQEEEQQQQQQREQQQLQAQGQGHGQGQAQTQVTTAQQQSPSGDGPQNVSTAIPLKTETAANTSQPPQNQQPQQQQQQQQSSPVERKDSFQPFNWGDDD